MRFKSFFAQITFSLLLVALLSVTALTWITTRSWRHFFLSHLVSDLEARARLLAVPVGQDLEQGDLKGLAPLLKEMGQHTNTRYTVILPTGEVVADSLRDAATMENHRDRPEIQKALQGKVGQDQRLSPTQGTLTLYVAVPVEVRGQILGVVRAALPLEEIRQGLYLVYARLMAGSVVIFLLAGILSLYLSRRLTRPLEEFRRGAERFARGDFSLKLPKPPLAELESLGETMNAMAAQLDERIGTILRQRQEQEAVLSSMSEGVIAVDNHSRILFLNRAAATLLGVDPEGAVGRKITEVAANPDLQWLITRAVAAAAPVEGEIVLKGEKNRYLQAHGTLLKDPSGKAFGVLIVIHDITRLRQLENARRDFVANVSHELKTPITSIKGFVETLLEGALTDPAHAEEFLRIIGRQVDRLAAIIDDLLSLSRIEEEAEKGRIHLEGQKLRPILKAALQTCQSRSAEKQISLELECPEDLRAKVNGPLLEQALINLIDNAIKYSPPESRVLVSAHKEDHQVVIRVTDQGIGIPPEHLPRIFERFYRVDPSRSRTLGGTGLGLAIVKHIAQAHGGKVTVQSTLGQGSVFSLYLQEDRGD